MHSFITKISCYLPEQIVENENNRLTKKTGILRRHIAGKTQTASDMAVLAAEKLFASNIDRTKIDFLLFCTQSPDYILPASSCLIQHRLSLPTACGALDFNHGCSGYIYGLSLAKALIESDLAKRVLLLTAETYSKYINPKDGAVGPLFGDAATATLVEGFTEESSSGLYGFELGTDGSGASELIIPAGGARSPVETTPVEEYVDTYGNRRTNRDLYMNGAAISEFALQRVPRMIESILARTSLSREDIDYVIFHQANHFMLKYLQQKCELMDTPFWNDVSEYGNTVSCSIPLAIHELITKFPQLQRKRVLLTGFGVGLTWGGCIANLSRLK